VPDLTPEQRRLLKVQLEEAQEAIEDDDKLTELAKFAANLAALSLLCLGAYALPQNPDVWRCLNALIFVPLLGWAAIRWAAARTSCRSWKNLRAEQLQERRAAGIALDGDEKPL